MKSEARDRLVRGADKLMEELLKSALMPERKDDSDFGLNVMDRVTRYLLAKNRLPDAPEENAFDRFRGALGGGDAAATPSDGAQRKTRRGTPTTALASLQNGLRDYGNPRAAAQAARSADRKRPRANTIAAREKAGG